MSDKIVLVCDGTPAIGAAIRKSITDKEKVLAKWPDAKLFWSIAGCRVANVNINESIDVLSNRHSTESEAWADAARRLDNV